MHTIRSLATAAAVTVGLLFSATHAQAQAQTADKTKGLVLGAHLNGTSIAYEDEDSEVGGGGGLMVGWGFNKRFMLYANVDVVKVKFRLVGDCLFDCEEGEGIGTVSTADGDFSLVHGDIGVRFSFPSANHGWVPYLNAALTSRTAAAEIEDVDISLSGGAITAGAGVQYFFNQKFAFDASLLFSAGKFNKLKGAGITIDLDDFGDVDNTNSVRLNLGVKYYPHFGGK